MEYKITINNFDGPLDLLLHLIKESDINIFDINISDITKQYLDYITSMEQFNLNVASEYLTMAAELIEMKSSTLLPKQKQNEIEEEDPREKLINRLLEYKRYKEVSSVFKKLEEVRKDFFTKEPSDLNPYNEKDIEIISDFSKDDLLLAFSKFLERKKDEKPLNTKITSKEYSVRERSNEIYKLVSKNKRISFDDLFEVMSKDYIIVTFLSILELSKKQFVVIEQENNFDSIFLVKKGSV